MADPGGWQPARTIRSPSGYASDGPLGRQLTRTPSVAEPSAARNELSVHAGYISQINKIDYPGRDAGFTLRPPDRSEQALLTHSAPTSGV
jgi:hypothetical protein